MFKVIVLVSSLLLVACATTVAPVINPNSPINIYGVMALPPQNGDWIVMAATGYQSSLASKGSNENESLVVNVSIFQLPELDTAKELLEYVVNARASTPNTGRFENQENTEKLSSLNDAVCVKYRSVSKDTNAKVQGAKASMLLESIGYNCQHPLKNTIGVNIEYSSRHFAGNKDSSIEKNSEEFFSNIQFTNF